MPQAPAGWMKNFVVKWDARWARAHQNRFGQPANALSGLALV
jgi:hypothetical protein